MCTPKFPETVVLVALVLVLFKWYLMQTPILTPTTRARNWSLVLNRSSFITRMSLFVCGLVYVFTTNNGVKCKVITAAVVFSESVPA